MKLLRTRDELREWRDAERGSVALVPTMGALHEGHLSHVDVARGAVGEAGKVVVSVFVNPTQFGPGEDFSAYPRDLEKDAARCAERGADVVFAPGSDEMYPEGVPACEVHVPAVAGAAGLEGERRPGHFGGVCRVVMKLLGLVRPGVATFGRKDFQQLAVVRAMVADLCVPVEVLSVETMREADGLAMSSRNAYLSGDERVRAVGLSVALRSARGAVGHGERSVWVLEEAMRQCLGHHGIRAADVDYAVVRDRATLGPPARSDADSGGWVGLVAARVGGTRLIDNMDLG